MARYNFVKHIVEYEENVPEDRNAAQILAMQASAEVQPDPDDTDAIAGTRTSDTIFTRTAGTWTVDEVIGKFLWSFATGTPKTGNFLKISDNATDTVTIDSTYGAGALEATGTSILILDSTDEDEAMALLEDNSAWVKTS